MSLVKYNPFRPIAFDNFFDDFFGGGLSEFARADSGSSAPSVNVIENDDAFVIDVAAPGLTKEDFNLEIDNDRLIISAEKKAETEDKEEGKYTRREFNYTSFRRSFHLSDAIDTSKIDAGYADGILKITVGKKDSAITKAPQTIEIR